MKGVQMKRKTREDGMEKLENEWREKAFKDGFLKD